MMRALIAGFCFALGTLAAAAELPIFDAHIHYSHDAWDAVPPKMAIEILRKAGVRRALVSSSSDDGTQKLFAEAPDIIIPSLRPYRSRGELGTWVRDETIVPYVEERLRRYRYVAIGEFHVYGADADLPVVRRTVRLARQYQLFIHIHSDADAVERVFKQDPGARVLWAHAGFDRFEQSCDPVGVAALAQPFHVGPGEPILEEQVHPVKNDAEKRIGGDQPEKEVRVRDGPAEKRRHTRQQGENKTSGHPRTEPSCSHGKEEKVKQKAQPDKISFGVKGRREGGKNLRDLPEEKEAPGDGTRKGNLPLTSQVQCETPRKERLDIKRSPFLSPGQRSGPCSCRRQPVRLDSRSRCPGC